MKPKLKFMLDYGANPLWSDDDTTRQKHGYQIDNLENLGLSKGTIELSEFVSELYWVRLNPIYQNLPSFWSGEMYIFFQKKLKELYDSINIEIGNQYDIENKEQEEINAKIDTQKVNQNLLQFISDPIKYYKTNNISFNKSDIEEIEIIINEFEKWKQREKRLLEENQFTS